MWLQIKRINKMLALVVYLVALPFFVSAAPNGRIFGGIDAKPGQLPYMVSIQYNGSHNCGGSIISRRIILTAAHCLGGSPSDYKIYVGSIALDGDGLRLNVSAYKQHPSWFPETLAFDTGVLYLTKDLEFSPLVQPIPLDSEFIGGGEFVEASGWGLSEETNPPNILQYLTKKTVTNEYCQSLMNAANKTVHFSNICTESPVGQGMCFGDSGSPLVKNGKQIGVVSWGIPCGTHFPDSFQRISFSYEWLQTIIQ